MVYYKQLSDNYILAIGTGPGGTEITETEYNSILSVIQSRPTSETKGYRLRTDLTWEEYDLPPEPEPSDEDELSDAEALNILLGGAV
jgi:hypothetical protein